MSQGPYRRNNHAANLRPRKASRKTGESSGDQAKQSQAAARKWRGCVRSGGFYDADAIDQFGPNGFDAIWLEGEHGNVDFRDIGDYTRACDIWGLTSVVRINMNEPGVVYRTLDRGRPGSCDAARKHARRGGAVRGRCKFAPIGNRGMFTSRQGYDVPDYFQVATIRHFWSY